MSTVKANTIEPASGGTVTITGAALTTPALGTPASGTLTNCTGFPVANLSGTTMPSAVVNSSLNAITPSGGALAVSGNLSTVGVVSSSRYQSTSSTDALPAYGVEAGSGIFNAGASTIGFSVGSSEQMRLTSTGLGIGTSSPTYKLQVSSGSSGATCGFVSTNSTAYSATAHNGATARILVQGGGASGAANGIEFTQGGSSELFFGQVQESGGAAAFVWQGYNGSAYAERMRLDASGNLLVGVASGSAHTLKKDVSQGTDIAVVTSNAGGRSARVLAVAAEGWNTADAAILVGKNDVTNRGINSGGTINASGADAAEYECNGGLKIAKGQIVGFGPDGVLTDRFDAAIRFGVKSTDPHIVGGDTWGTKDKIGERPEKPAALHEDATEQEAQAHAQAVAKYQIDIAAFSARLEAARQQVDRIAYCGKVPCNVTGAAPGDYIVAVNDGSGGIKGLAVRSPTFDQYRAAVGRVNRILPDGRAEIAVIVH